MAVAAVKTMLRDFRSTLLPWAVLAVGILASVILFMFIQASIDRVARLRFERETNSANAIIEGRFRSYSDVLYSLRALFASEETVDRLRFHRFVQSLDLKQRYPALVSLNYAALVRGSDKRRFEESVRGDTSLDSRGYPHFAIKPPGDRPEYYVAVFLEPMAGFEFGFGLDIGANPMAADPGKGVATLRLQRDSGKLIASGQPLRVMRGKEAIYLAMRLPVYNPRMPIDEVAQRRAAYIGSVGAAFDVESLMRGALNEEMLRRVRFRLYDARSASDPSSSESAEGKRLLFDSDKLTKQSPGNSATDGSKPMFTHVLAVKIATRIWEFEYSAQKSSIISDTDRLLPPLVLMGGLLSSLLLSGILYSLASSHGRAVALANEMTGDLRASTAQLEALSRRLVEVQETERKQLARELHDRVGQNLTALGINLDILKTRLAGGPGDDTRVRVEDSAAIVASTADAIDDVMSELHPPMLEDYGLLPALQWYARDFTTRTGIAVNVHGTETSGRPAPGVEIALFRIAQEALNNVAKHAHASHADVELDHVNGICTMSVSDDGAGFEPDRAPMAKARHGLGMVSMRERTQAVGGKFEVRAAPGRGTQIIVRIPA